MLRPKSLLPQYRNHSSGQARVTINGRDHLLGPHGTIASKREYDRLIAEYLASGRSSTFGFEAENNRVGELTGPLADQNNDIRRLLLLQQLPHGIARTVQRRERSVSSL